MTVGKATIFPHESFYSVQVAFSRVSISSLKKLMMMMHFKCVRLLFFFATKSVACQFYFYGNHITTETFFSSSEMAELPELPTLIAALFL